MEKDLKLNNEDSINPSYYNKEQISCLDAMIAAYGIEAVIHFCMCNSFKYMWRFAQKNGLEDIKKAQWYQDKLVELTHKLEDGIQ